MSTRTTTIPKHFHDAVSSAVMRNVAAWPRRRKVPVTLGVVVVVAGLVWLWWPAENPSSAVPPVLATGCPDATGSRLPLAVVCPGRAHRPARRLRITGTSALERLVGKRASS